MIPAARQTDAAVACMTGRICGYRAPMAATPHITVEPRSDGRWAVKKAGTSRASALFKTKSAAETRARSQAKRERAELVVKNADGTIERRDSHGSDPRRTKG